MQNVTVTVLFVAISNIPYIKAAHFFRFWRWKVGDAAVTRVHLNRTFLKAFFFCELANVITAEILFH